MSRSAEAGTQSRQQSAASDTLWTADRGMRMERKQLRFDVLGPGFLNHQRIFPNNQGRERNWVGGEIHKNYKIIFFHKLQSEDRLERGRKRKCCNFNEIFNEKKKLN